MIAVVQRVTQASVSIEGKIVGKIDQGLLVLLGISNSDSEEDADYLVKKIAALRIFSDSDGKMNLDVREVFGDILLISQFTLLASTKKGNRPSFIDAAPPHRAIPLYTFTHNLLEGAMGKTVPTGAFGADMQVSLTNDGPVTIVIDSQNRK